MRRISLFPAVLLTMVASGTALHAQESCVGKMRLTSIKTLKSAASTLPARYTFEVTNLTDKETSARVYFRNLPSGMKMDAQEYVVLVGPRKTGHAVFFGTATSDKPYPTVDLSNTKITYDKTSATGTYATVFFCIAR